MKFVLYLISILAITSAGAILQYVVLNNTVVNSLMLGGSLLVPLDWYFQQTYNPGTCAGTYSCSRELCKMLKLPNTTYIAVQLDSFFNPNDACPISIGETASLASKGLFFSVLALLYASILLEIVFIPVVIYFKMLRAVWWSSNILLLCSWILYITFMAKLEKETEKTPGFLKALIAICGAISMTLGISIKALVLYGKNSQYEIL